MSGQCPGHVSAGDDPEPTVVDDDSGRLVADPERADDPVRRWVDLRDGRVVAACHPNGTAADGHGERTVAHGNTSLHTPEQWIDLPHDVGQVVGDPYRVIPDRERPRS